MICSTQVLYFVVVIYCPLHLTVMKCSVTCKSKNPEVHLVVEYSSFNTIGLHFKLKKYLSVWFICEMFVFLCFREGLYYMKTKGISPFSFQCLRQVKVSYYVCFRFSKSNTVFPASASKEEGREGRVVKYSNIHLFLVNYDQIWKKVERGGWEIFKHLFISSQFRIWKAGKVAVKSFVALSVSVCLWNQSLEP